MLNRREIALQDGEQGRVRPAGKDLGDEGATRHQRRDREIRRRLDEAHGAQMIGLGVADGIGRHVRQDEIGRPAERGDEAVGRFVGHEIHFQQHHAGQRLDRQQIDADDDGIGHYLAGNLRPAARRRAEVDDGLAAFEDMELLVELDELVGGAAPVSLGLGALHIGIVELPGEPARRLGGAGCARS